MNLGLPIDLEKGRAFTSVHGIDQAVGSGPNTFLVEMVGGNGGIGGTGVLPEQFWRRRWRVEREMGRGWNGGSGEEDPHPVPYPDF
jgi:hypothetical protein